MDKNALLSLAGSTALITGANSGIGREVVAALADMGAHVVMACRSEKRGTEALEALLKENCERSLELMYVDLASQKSISEFAEAFLSTHERLDILINNAGVLSTKRTTTLDGFELHFGVNYLGPFMLTLSLLPALKRARQGRIVMLNSLAHKWTYVHFDDIGLEQRYNRLLAYGHSKLCSLLFVRYLARELKRAGSPITINAVHPGVVASNIIVDRHSNAFKWVAKLSRLVLISSKQGAKTPVYLACAPELEGVSGEYFVRNRIAPSSEASRDIASAERLFKMSLAMCNLSYDDLSEVLYG